MRPSTIKRPGVGWRRLVATGWGVLFSSLFSLLPIALTAWQIQSAPMPVPEEDPTTYFNVPFATLGGKQFWSDVVHRGDYRIQKNVTTDHYRLLDSSDTRLAWGNRAGCQQALNKIVAERGLKPVSGHVVIVLHGLSRTRSSMASMAEVIGQQTGATVLNVSYASGRTDIQEHAAALASIIDAIPEATAIDFVAHSLGNIIVRHYLAAYGHDPRFRRMVMLGPPNNGSQLATWLRNNWVFKAATGKAGQQLGTSFDEIESSLATPAFEFAIIAGATGQESGLSNPLVEDRNDWIVGVDETRLTGAADFHVGDYWHATIMDNAEVQQATVQFLQFGFLRSHETRTPIK